MKYNFKIYYSYCTKCKCFRNCYEVDDEYSNHFPNYISEECSIVEENLKDGKVRCKRCLKEAHEIDEYVEMAKEEKYKSAEDYVKHEEGTYNPNTGMFYCTSCYIKVGMPKGIA